MKKIMSVLLVLLALLMTMASCSVAEAVQKLDAAEETLENRLEAAEENLEVVEDQLENSLREMVSPEPAAPAAPAQTQPAPVETQPVPPAAPKSSGVLTEEEARQVALDHQGFTAEQVTRLRTEYEIDDGIPQFDVEYLQGDWEYEFEIHAETGRILSYDKDHKYD